MDEKKLIQNLRTTAPSCLKGFHSTPTKLAKPFDKNPSSVWQLACKCGNPNGRFLGYSLKDYNKEDDGPKSFIDPLAIECSQCKKVTELLDTERHGYHADAALRERDESGSTKYHGEGPRKAWACQSCKAEVFSIIVGFVFWNVDELSEEFENRWEDLFSVFLCYCKCVACNKTSEPTEFGKLYDAEPGAAPDGPQSRPAGELVRSAADTKIFGGVGMRCLVATVTCFLTVAAASAADVPEKMHYLGEVKLSGPDGRSYGSQVILLVKTHDRAKSEITERAIVVKPDGKVEDRTVRMIVNGNAVEVSDDAKTVTGTGELSGPTWKWTYFKGVFKTDKGVKVEDENFMADPSVLTARKTVTGADGMVMLRMDMTLKAVTPATFEVLATGLLKK